MHDFVADQDAEAAALSKSDESLLNNRLSDAALSDVAGQIHEAGPGVAQTISFEASSITVLRAQDPNDPTLLIEVQEDGARSVTTSKEPNSVPTQDQVSFHGDFWLRPNGDHYTIADQNIQNLPASYLPQVGLAALALLWVGLAWVLMRRTQNKPVLGLKQVPASRVAPSALLETEQLEPAATAEPTPKVVIRTFGGLQVIEEGKDWAPELSTRPVTSFVWRRVLLAAVEGRALSREELSRQAYPQFDRETQLGRLRNLIYQWRRELPKPLRGRIVAEPQVLRFNLDDCTVDAIELLKVSAESAGRGSLPLTHLTRVGRVVEASRGTLMPEFEMVEDLATDHHSTCTAMLGDLRQHLSMKRADLIVLLAKSQIASGRADQAVAYLEPARQDYPDRKDIPEYLASAYRAAGRDAEARALAGPDR